jgi:hypothetical protein
MKLFEKGTSKQTGVHLQTDRSARVQAFMGPAHIKEVHIINVQQCYRTFDLIIRKHPIFRVPREW